MNLSLGKDFCLPNENVSIEETFTSHLTTLQEKQELRIWECFRDGENPFGFINIFTFAYISLLSKLVWTAGMDYLLYIFFIVPN